MASAPLTPVANGFDLTTDWQTLYQVSSADLRAGLDAALFNNYSATSVDFSVRIVQSGTPTVLHELISNDPIRAGRNNLAPGIIGQAILTGGSIQAKASANSSVSAALTVTTISASDT
jgi:hypothetical protein